MTHDPLLEKIADYALHYKTPSTEALKCARLCLADSMGCAMLALHFPECRNLLGPWVDGTIVPHGARIPGLDLVMDPVMGAFTFGSMIRWLDYNDTFLAKEWAHPSDTIGALLPLMDYLSRKAIAQKKPPFKVRDLLLAMVKAYEIQGGLALENAFNLVGIDHVILVKVAVAAVSTQLLGGDASQILNSLSQAFIDLGPLRAYRHAPNTGSRKSWAAGDAAARGVALALLTLRGEPGYQTPLSAPRFGLESVLFQNNPLTLTHSLGCYIIENILFKISYPAEFHAQTAIEAAILSFPHIKNLDDITRIDIETHEAAIRIIDKKGDLKNPADRDHCMQYMVAIALIHGRLSAEHYNKEAAQNPKIDELRSKMHLKEHKKFTKDYFDPAIRSIASTLTITFKDKTTLGPQTVEFPLGHKRRREESIAPLYKKLKSNLATQFLPPKVEEILDLFQNEDKLDALTIPEFVDLFIHSKE